MGRAKVSISLTGKEIWYLKELLAAGERGRSICNSTPRAALKRLVKAGYVSEKPIDIDAAIFMITEQGRRALAATSSRQ